MNISESIVETRVERLDAISLKERKRLTHIEDRPGVYAEIYQQQAPLNQVEVRNQFQTTLPNKSSLKIGFWNLERCKYLPETIELIGEHNLDLVLLAEMDLGMARSSQQHTTRVLANKLNMNYAFGIEFIELGLGDDRESLWHKGEENLHGFHGGGIIAKQPLVNAKLFRFSDSGFWWQQPFEDQRRIGSRIAITSHIKLEGIPVLVVAVHFESHSNPDHRADQMRQLLTAVEQIVDSNQPCLIGGDFNTNTLSRLCNQLEESKQELVEKNPDRFLQPQVYEPLFKVAEEYGFQWRQCNLEKVSTQRTRPDGTPTPPFGQIDWFFSRHLITKCPNVIPATDKNNNAISDHELITINISLES